MKCVLRQLSVSSTLLALLVAGCAVLTIDTWRNPKLRPDEPPKPTAARTTISVQDLSHSHGVFIGVAMSGGGSRAANFSAAVLLELQDLGILPYVTALSSVSGSSLTAAYYGLHHDREHFNRDRMKELLRRNFENRWIGRWFLPQNVVRYWFTNFARSDIMEAVFDSNLFSKKTFDDLDRDGPRVLINATSYTTGRRFVFSDETFLELRSRLNRVPISHAVMASGAFPGAFHDVTLANYTGSEARTYEHLFDGGPADNLGVTTLLEMIGHLYRGPRDQSPKGCLLIIVDAFTYQERPKHTREADTRKFFDFVFDTNVIAASDVLLTTRRIDLLRDLGIDVLARNFSPFREFAVGSERHMCKSWVLTFQRLASDDLRRLSSKAAEIGAVVNAVPTRYRLIGEPPLDTRTVQDYIYTATRILLREDRDDPDNPAGHVFLERLCGWLTRDHGLSCSGATRG